MTRPPTAAIEAAHRDQRSALPFDDTADFDDADRGFIAALEPCVITAGDGHVVWDNDAYAFLQGEAPTSVHPSLGASPVWLRVKGSTRWSRVSTRCAGSTCRTSRSSRVTPASSSSTR